jgi:uncharacterized membrane protein YhaH (DUF805 family)
MLVSFWPLLLFTHSLLMNNPIGWVYFLPFGAVNSTASSGFGECEVPSAFSGVIMLSILTAVVVRRSRDMGRKTKEVELVICLLTTFLTPA